MPAVELYGDLSQGVRVRNLRAFSDGTARTFVATDIAARGIHVDDVARVVHADPPLEHKAYCIALVESPAQARTARWSPS